MKKTLSQYKQDTGNLLNKILSYSQLQTLVSGRDLFYLLDSIIETKDSNVKILDFSVIIDNYIFRSIKKGFIQIKSSIDITAEWSKDISVMADTDIGIELQKADKGICIIRPKITKDTPGLMSAAGLSTELTKVRAFVNKSDDN